MYIDSYKEKVDFHFVEEKESKQIYYLYRNSV